ncbi:hypothetical protein [Paractinoplanes atraurantiacus]|uniref:Uncharacterized protein n=1 Tax=Paractinoplanes atraurantiacus TaxID=1036182 RepID=A0A285JE42_9ACTN|nr:hypothetical protein [Actinoplanes atraurantiacus]SNY58343.1 hypothetical protein SAMN05421748_11969 [Actinoplanes atraurantiacus]
MTTPSPDPLPLRWATILTIAALAGLVIGMLTFAQSAAWPAALLAALGAAGVTVPVAHQLLART